ncbi:MAG: LacI family transcriptional regulator [Acidobacteria bacterium]|nr:LacI family transcriptional regulator [Acidobacteriota bacterium]
MAGPPRLSDPAGRATILDVAAAAGVSRQTVTRAMNDMPGINAATKERVLAVAERLGYRPSRFGRGLVLGGERQLGLIVDDLRNPYSPELAAAVVRVAAARGWNVMLADVALAGDADRMVASLGAQTDAVIGYFGLRAADWIGLLGSVPVVELDPAGPVTRGAVHLDPTSAVEELVAHLVAAGAAAPVVLDAPRAPGTSRRAALVRDAFDRRGLVAAVVPLAEPTAAAAADAASALIASAGPPDAIVAFNDVMAIGVLAACRRAGVDVPGDVRVAGVDGLPLGALLAPALTTLAVDFDAVATAALDLVGEVRHGSSGSRAVPHRLLLRESA